MRSRVRFPVLPWRFFLEGEDTHGKHGLCSLVDLKFKAPPGTSYISPSTSSEQRNCASWASQPQKSVTLRPQPGGETTKSIREMWGGGIKNFISNYISNCAYLVMIITTSFTGTTERQII